MQLTSILVSALFAFGLHAAPVADDAGQSMVIDGRKIFKRSGQLCRVLSEHVNCRSGPVTKYPSTVQLSDSWTRGYYFTCVKSGECITLNGAVNWYVYTLVD